MSNARWSARPLGVLAVAMNLLSGYAMGGSDAGMPPIPYADDGPAGAAVNIAPDLSNCVVIWSIFHDLYR